MRRLLLAGAASVAPFLPLAPVHAQDVAPDDQAATGDETIVVTGQRARLERSIEFKREALGVVDVTASDEIAQLPDRNVAEVVERLPGVGVQYDQGEGRYVSIRGVPAELNQYTFNGFELGNPDGETRRLPLDIVSGQLLNRIEVYKVKTPNQDGQGIGGLVNLVPQTAFDFQQPLIAIANAQIGWQEIDDRTPVRGDISLGTRSGEVGILVGASYSDRTFNSYGFFPDDWAPVPGAARGGLPVNIKFSEYEIKRERIGVTEANKLEIPVIGTGDTNVDPDELDYIIPANDDAIRSIRLLCQLVADAAIEGGRERAARAAAEPQPEPVVEAPDFDDAETDEIVARLAAGEALSFAPDLDDDELLPGAPGAKPPVAPEASPEEIEAELAREAQERESASA